MAKSKSQSCSDMDIPNYAIERIARSMLPMIQIYYDSEEGQQELAAWKAQWEKEKLEEEDKAK